MSVQEPELGQTIIREEVDFIEICDGKTGVYIEEIRQRIDTTIRLSHIDTDTILPFMDGMTVLQELGRGGMGTVFLARQHDTNALFAVKVINAQGDSNSVKSESERMARARREFESAVRARREFEIVQNAYRNGVRCVPEPYAYEILRNNEDERHCIVTEFIPGRDAASIIQAKGPLSIHEAFWFAIKTSDGLSAIHKAGMVHRDIKPSNIMIGGEKDVTIMDFGLVRDTNEKTITQDHAFLGTLPYIAPEVFINGGDSNSAPCDVYALGITFYEVLVGKKPLELKNPIDYFNFWRSDTLKLIIKKDSCPIANNPSEQEFVDGLFNLIVEMTHPNPEKRFKMEEVTTALSAIGKLPNTPASKIALPTIDYTTEQHSPETVREYMSDAATTVQWGNKPSALNGFSPDRTAEFTHISPQAIKEYSQKTRWKILRILGLSTLSAAGILAYMKNDARDLSNADAPPLPVVTTPNLIEVPKPTHIHIGRSTEGLVSEIYFQVDTPEFKTNISLDPSEATIVQIQYDDNKILDHNQVEQVSLEQDEPQFCLGFMCNADVGVAASKIIYERSNQEPMPAATEGKFLFIYTMKNGDCIFYFPSLGVIFQSDEELTRYTLQDIKSGLHGKNPILMHILESIDVQISEDSEPIQSIPEEVVIRHKYGREYAPKFKMRPKTYLKSLITSGKNIITPVSATSN